MPTVTRYAHLRFRRGRLAATLTSAAAVVLATTLGILGSATWGPAQGTATITYTDGSTQAFTLGFSDWTQGGSPPAGETVVASMPYRNSPSGGDNSATYLFATTVALQAGKTIASITLPAILNQGWPAAIHVFAITTGSAA
jgi:hypothetical protein